MAYVANSKSVRKRLAKMPKVQAAVQKEAEAIQARAEAGLVQHRKTGAAKVVLARGEIDRYILLEDRRNTTQDHAAAWAIEYGHHNVRTGRWTEGIYVLTKAAGLI